MNNYVSSFYLSIYTTCVDSVAIGVEETKPVINAGLGRSWVASHDPKTIHIFSIARVDVF